MAALSDYLENKIVDHILRATAFTAPATVYVGLLTAALAAFAGLTDFMGDDRIRKIGQAVRHMIANVTVVVIEAINLLIRVTTPDSILTIGIFLSGIAVLVLLYSGWLGGELVFRHRVGVQDSDR